MAFYGILFHVATYILISSAQQVSRDDLLRFADANNNLADSLYPRLIDGSSSNIFFCPLSLMTGLGIMLYGSRGQTTQELYSVLGYKAAGLPLDKIAPTYSYYFANMLPENNQNLANYSLFCADEVLVTDQDQLYPSFRNNAEKIYDTTIENIDFSYNDNVARGINNFVNQHTYGKLRQIVNSVNPKSLSLLIDAVYFKGKWEAPFMTESFSEPFYSANGVRNVAFNAVIHSFPYYETADYQAVFLPYIGRNVGLLILLPRQQDGLAELEKTMTPKNIVNVLNQLHTKLTSVLLPEFRIYYTRDFKKDFVALGATSTFDGSGDFSDATNANGLSVSAVLHEAALELDYSKEYGRPNTFSSTPQVFSADHPFMFAVVDIRLSLLLFLGHVTNV